MWTLRLRAAIRSGRLAEGRSLPTAVSVIEHVGLLSEISVGTAYRQLAREGYLVIERGGVGTKVASRDRWPSTPPPKAGWLISPEDLLEIFTAEKSLRELNSAAGSINRMVSTALREAIVSGRLRPGVVLPTTAELGSCLPASDSPVKEAYRQLSGEGYLVGVHKEATMVADRDQWPTVSTDQSVTHDGRQTATHSVPETDQSTPPPAAGPPPRGHGLSGFEVEVLELTAKGLSAREIAEAADVYPYKVHYSFARIRVKLGIHGDHAALVEAAKRRGIIGADGDPGTTEVRRGGINFSQQQAAGHGRPSVAAGVQDPVSEASQPAMLQATADGEDIHKSQATPADDAT
ncbi:GntR family transcriptional regulator, partial [Nocardia sp. NPDC019302]|uniref:GntR family transcriptional regulator n=1 Tax=Nocardia sp. NPDC019302 TaxID=3154592 RepID=UPI0033E8CBDD